MPESAAQSASSPSPLILVDGSSYMFRAYHALPPLITSAGEPTGALLGVANMLRKLLREHMPRHMAVVFDASGPNFRHELYADYKANRPPTPPELAAQIAALHELVEAMGLPLLCIDGVEADDVIATLTRQAQAANLPVLISTSDKDLAQLVAPGVRLVDTMTDHYLDDAGVVTKFGVAPARVGDYLALIGDSSDNIPGIAKVGPKTAVKWLQTYGDLDGVIAHADAIKGKVGENLRANCEQLRRSRELVQLRADVELPLTLEALRVAEPEPDRLRALLQRFEFKTWLREIGSSPDEKAAETPALNSTYTGIVSEDPLAHWLERLAAAELIAFDTETTDLRHSHAELVGLSFCVTPGDAAYIPLAHSGADGAAQLDRDAVLERLRPLLEDPAKPKLGHHLKYDCNILAHYGIEVDGIAHDTMLASYVLNPTASRHDLDTLSLKHLGHQNTSFEDVAGKGAKQLSFDQVPVATAIDYAAEDADMTLQLHHALWPQLQALPRQCELYTHLEMPLVPVLARMERHGVKVDAARLAAQTEALAARMQDLEAEAHEQAGQVFNLGSPKQIQEILYERLHLPVLRKTPKGQPSTAEDVLQELALDYPLPALILEHRGLSKLRSTYTERLPEQIAPRTGRVHTSYHQAVTATGRLSSAEPNLQNIPVRTEAGRRIRQAFVAEPGCRLLAADYSQIELRIMAHLSGDAGLLQAFQDDRDIHQATAAEVFGTRAAAVTGEQRRAAKAINFGLIYGMSAFGLARQLGISRDAAQAYVDRYFERYPGVRAYMEQIREQARQAGYVETVFGRRLYLPEINARNAQRRQAAERTAINAPMQGTAADIIKRAMLTVDAWLQRSACDARMIMQVHDELVFEVAETAIDLVTEAVRARMAAAAELRVPLIVEVGVGENWDEAH